MHIQPVAAFGLVFMKQEACGLSSDPGLQRIIFRPQLLLFRTGGIEQGECGLQLLLNFA